VLYLELSLAMETQCVAAGHVNSLGVSLSLLLSTIVRNVFAVEDGA
jgi:hypothetical protein